MTVLCNETTLLVCQHLFSTLTFDMFKVGSRYTGNLLFSRELVSLLLT